MKRQIMLLVASSVLSVAGSAWIHVSAEQGDPEWVGTDSKGNFGVVDVSKMPETMPVVDSNGDVVGYANTAEVYAPPTDDPADPAAKRRVAERAAKGLPPETPAPVTVYDGNSKRIGIVGARGFVRQSGS